MERGFESFVAVGNALREIRDCHFYRETHATFEEYLNARWDMSRGVVVGNPARQIREVPDAELL